MCYVNAYDIEVVFDKLHDIARKSNNLQARLFCGHVLPSLLTFFSNIKFVPTKHTPWWFMQLLHTCLLNNGVDFATFMQSMHTVNNLNAKCLLMPFRPEYASRWPEKDRAAASQTYKALLQVPYFTLWQATTVNAIEQYTPWSPRLHCHWPISYRRAVCILMYCTQCPAKHSLPNLPIELVELILRFCFQHDFRL